MEVRLREMVRVQALVLSSMDQICESDSLDEAVASESLNDLFRRCPTKRELVKVMEDYSVKTLVELPERRLIGLLDSLQNSKGLGFLDYSCILKCVRREKRYLHEGSKRRKGHNFEQLNTNAVMDERLWSALPEHLLDRILACLPLPSLLCMRTVCKRWSTLLSSPSFLNVCTEVPQKPSLLGILEKGEHGWLAQGCYTFCSVSRRWYNIDLGPLPFHEGGQLAASEGLFCYIPLVDGEDGDCIIICNPLTRAWRSVVLPEEIQMLSLLAIVVDEVTHGYKIIVTALMQKLEGPRLDGYNLTTQVYDSRTKIWKGTGRLPPGLHFPLHSVLCNGHLYGWCSKADRIWIYDIDREVWKGEALSIPEEARSSNVHVVECKRRVFLVTETEYSGHGPQIWELNLMTMACTELDEVPQELFQNFFENVCEFQCVGYDDAICFIAHERPEVLTYQITTKLWMWMPRCPEVPDWHPYGYLGFPLKLRLDVSV